MLLFTKPLVRLRDFHNFIIIMGSNHATLGEDKSIIAFSTVHSKKCTRLQIYLFGITKMDQYFVLVFCCIVSYCFDHLRLWKTLISYVGTDLLVHFGLIPFLAINITFYSLALFMVSFDLKATNDKVN